MIVLSKCFLLSDITNKMFGLVPTFFNPFVRKINERTSSFNSRSFLTKLTKLVVHLMFFFSFVNVKLPFVNDLHFSIVVMVNLTNFFIN